MHLPVPLPLRHAVVCAAVGLALTAAGSVASAQPRSAAAPALVHGLIVQLRDAPSHVALARERALGRDASAVTRESARWLHLVAELRGDTSVQRELPAWASAAPQRDPVGASAQLLRFARPLSAEQAERVAARLAARPDVAWVAANTRERRQAIATNAPNDYYFALGLTGQWWLQAMGSGGNGSPIAMRLRGVANFLPAWLGSSTGSAAAVVAVLDTGITCHPDLGNMTANCIGGAILPGYDFVSDDPVARLLYANDGDGRDSDPRDPGDWVSAEDRQQNPQAFADCEVEPSSWHGTVNAGIVAAQTDNNGVGVAAINWHGRVLPVRVAGKCGADVSDIVDGMHWAAGLPVCKTSDGNGACTEFVPTNLNPARIVNISFGGDPACNEAYQQAINDLRVAPGGGAVVVAAAGNLHSAPSRPASCTGVIGVGALNRDGFKSNYSNFGAALVISTVGGDDNFENSGAWASLLADSGLLTVGNGGSTKPADCTLVGANCYYNHWGTSFSAPVVAGAVSLMLSVNPSLTADQIVQGLTLSARPHVSFPGGVPNLSVCSNDNPGRCQCTKATCGAGILDVQQALLYASDPGVYVNTRTVGDIIDTPELRAAAASGPDRPANSPPSPPPSTGGGGGAMSTAWLLALALAAWALWRPLSAVTRPLRKAQSRRPTPCR